MASEAPLVFDTSLEPDSMNIICFWHKYVPLLKPVAAAVEAFFKHFTARANKKEDTTK